MKLPADPHFPIPAFGDDYLRRLVTRLTELFRWVHEATAKKYSGRYTPTLTNTTNVAASTAYECQYFRIDDVVHVAGAIDIDPTTAGLATEVSVSIPVASTFSAATDAAGCAVASFISGIAGRIYANVGASTVLIRFFAPADVANRSWTFEFTYRVV